MKVTDHGNLNKLVAVTAYHRWRKGLKVGGAEVPVVAAEVDPRR